LPRNGPLCCTEPLVCHLCCEGWGGVRQHIRFNSDTPEPTWHARVNIILMCKRELYIDMRPSVGFTVCTAFAPVSYIMSCSPLPDSYVTRLFHDRIVHRDLAKPHWCGLASQYQQSSSVCPDGGSPMSHNPWQTPVPVRVLPVTSQYRVSQTRLTPRVRLACGLEQ
jgi:hypothetical protein